ncbi:hypothetical protein KC19_VG133500 [Ceratodon purpureus]|uniref:Uncharacterized protein n=1 Tax=Ceratodon purpureus TaxID=3225 RepID=A0A8T0HQ27_CERPU|nr:hypothetical protein KC19_VG133500 [Ceratodon purpureus]
MKCAIDDFGNEGTNEDVLAVTKETSVEGVNGRNRNGVDNDDDDDDMYDPRSKLRNDKRLQQLATLTPLKEWRIQKGLSTAVTNASTSGGDIINLKWSGTIFEMPVSRDAQATAVVIEEKEKPLNSSSDEDESSALEEACRFWRVTMLEETATTSSSD